MTRCYIGLGGNVGAVAETFKEALDRLRDSGGSVQAVSGCFRTRPVGEHAGGEFLNAAAAVDWNRSALQLLDRLHDIEAELGRVRERVWGPRTIDLDLLFYGDRIVETPRLTIPHPACWYRRFVLDPLTEIAPELVHPVKQVTVRELRDRLLPRPLSVAVAGEPDRAVQAVMERLASEFPQIRCRRWPGPSCDDATAALIFWIGDSMPRIPARNAEFDSLPALPRIEVPGAGETAVQFACDVVRAALGE